MIYFIEIIIFSNFSINIFLTKQGPNSDVATLFHPFTTATNGEHPKQTRATHTEQPSLF